MLTFCLLLRQVMLYSPDCPGTCFVVQVHLKSATLLPYFMSLYGNMPRSILTVNLTA